jgi:hypothetical protein
MRLPRKTAAAQCGGEAAPHVGCASRAQMAEKKT